MKRIRLEHVAILVTLSGLVLSMVYPVLYEAKSAHPVEYDRIITLTGIAETGLWTDREVTGSNYWMGSFPPAEPRLRVGEKVLLRLKSADVIHKFYLPALDVGPVEVYPGHVKEIVLSPTEAGVMEFYCTAVCGKAHFGMRGRMIVEDGQPAKLEPKSLEIDEYWKEIPPPDGAGRVDQGRWLFRSSGCVTCHGATGEGGIPNFNYVKDTIPPLKTLAEKMMLFYPEDAAAIIEAIEGGVPLESLSDDPPVPRFNVFLAQYESVRNVILNGNPPGKKDPAGPQPPLEMLPWKERLTSKDVDSVLAYLLTLQEWEE